MKYFVSPTRPFGAIRFGLQMEKHGVYEVPSALAYDLYVEAEANPKNRMQYEHIDHSFETGYNVYVNNFVRIWGDEMTDKELFKMRINGDVKKEVVTEFNPTHKADEAE